MRGVVMLVVLTSCRFGFADHPATGSDARAGGDADGLRIAEVVAGVSTTCARSSTGLVTCWGNNDWGKLGIPSSDPSSRGDQAGEREQLAPIELGAGRTAAQLVRGADFTCALLDDATFKCWGNNDGGQLGLGDFDHRGDGDGEMGDALPVVVAGGERTFTAAAAGHYHACVARAGTVWCYGLNDFSQVGLGDAVAHVADTAMIAPVDLGAFAAVALSAQFNATCALDALGRVKCWGESGALGYGDDITRGYLPGQMGDQLPVLPFGIGVTVQQLASGYSHECAITSAGAVCWGSNAFGELGIGNTNHIGDDPGELATLVSIDVGAPITQLAGGDETTCALLATGEVACWGKNDDGQLGLGDTASRGDDPGELNASLRVPLPEPAVALACGHSHACAILASGAMACWGRNREGELGADDSDDRGDKAGDLPFVIRATDLW